MPFQLIPPPALVDKALYRAGGVEMYGIRVA